MLNLSQQALYVLDAKENLRISTLNHENITSFFSEVPETYPEHLTISTKCSLSHMMTISNLRKGTQIEISPQWN
jgi:hypothetical protein